MQGVLLRGSVDLKRGFKTLRSPCLLCETAQKYLLIKFSALEVFLIPWMRYPQVWSRKKKIETNITQMSSKFSYAQDSNITTLSLDLFMHAFYSMLHKLRSIGFWQRSWDVHRGEPKAAGRALSNAPFFWPYPDLGHLYNLLRAKLDVPVSWEPYSWICWVQ